MNLYYASTLRYFTQGLLTELLVLRLVGLRKCWALLRITLVLPLLHIYSKFIPLFVSYNYNKSIIYVSYYSDKMKSSPYVLLEMHRRLSDVVARETGCCTKDLGFKSRVSHGCQTARHRPPPVTERFFAKNW